MVICHGRIRKDNHLKQTKDEGYFEPERVEVPPTKMRDVSNQVIHTHPTLELK